MDSIWIEENKLFQDNIPSVQLVNSSKPMIQNTNTIELPPLPPTSYFQSLQKEQENREQQEREKLGTNGNGKFLKLFKKLTITHKEFKVENVAKVKPVRKISTPFAFSHISHVDNKPTPDAQVSAQSQYEATDKLSPLLGKEGPNAVSFNTTSPTQIMAKNGSFPRSASTSTIQSSVGKNSLFSRSESISSSLYSRKNSVNFSTPLNMKKLRTVSLTQVSVNNHKHNPNLQQEAIHINEKDDENEEIDLEYNKDINYNLQEILNSIDDFNQNYQRHSGEGKFLTPVEGVDHDDTIDDILNYHEEEDELRHLDNGLYQQDAAINKSDEVLYDKF